MTETFWLGPADGEFIGTSPRDGVPLVATPDGVEPMVEITRHVIFTPYEPEPDVWPEL